MPLRCVCSEVQRAWERGVLARTGRGRACSLTDVGSLDGRRRSSEGGAGLDEGRCGFAACGLGLAGWDLEDAGEVAVPP